MLTQLACLRAAKRAATVKAILPSGASSVAAAHSFARAARSRVERISRSAGVLNPCARTISASMSASRSVTYSSRMCGRPDASSATRSCPRSSTGFPRGPPRLTCAFLGSHAHIRASSTPRDTRLGRSNPAPLRPADTTRPTGSPCVARSASSSAPESLPTQPRRCRRSGTPPSSRPSEDTPAVGLAANRSIKVLARLSKRASPSPRSANSVSVQHAKAFMRKAKVNARRRKSTSPGLSHCPKTAYSGLRLRKANLCMRRCLTYVSVKTFSA